MYPTIQEIIGCNVSNGQVPFYDGKCWGYTNLIFSCEDIKNCVSEIFSQGAFEFTSDSINITDIFNLEIGNLNLPVSLVGNILSIGNRTIDLSPILKYTGFYFYNKGDKLGIGNGQTLNFVGLDGLRTSVSGGELTIRLPKPLKIYNTPGPNPDAPISYNEVQVLTWDECADEAVWMTPQCCLPPLVLSEGMIGFGEGQADITGFNTDNQILKYDHTVDKNILSLTQSHGAGIVDPDSTVNLEFVNEQRLGLSGNSLFLIGSTGNKYGYVNLNSVNRHTLELIGNDLTIFGSDGTDQGSVDLIVNNQYIGLYGNTLSLYNSKNNLISQTTLGGVNQHTIILDSNINLELYNSQGTLLSSVDISSVANKRFTIEKDFLKIGEGTIGCCNNGVYLGFLRGLTCEDVKDCMDLEINAIKTNINIVNNNYISIKDKIDQAKSRIRNLGDNTNSRQISMFNSKRYFAKIWTSDNRVVWTRHGLRGGGKSEAAKSCAENESKRFFPEFDQAIEGFGTPGFQIIDPTNFLQASDTKLIINSPLLTFDQPLPLINSEVPYQSGPSTNNEMATTFPDGWKACPNGSRTITIPKTGMYNVSLQGNIEVDHNIHAYRYSCWRFSPVNPDGITKKNRPMSIIIDTKYGGPRAVGSRSLNNPLYPCVNYYQHGGTKNVWLQRGDVLFVGIKIDVTTFWPKTLFTHPGNHGQTYMSDDSIDTNKRYAKLNSTGNTSLSGTCPEGSVSISPNPHNHTNSISYNPQAEGWQENNSNQLPWPGPHAPNIGVEEWLYGDPSTHGYWRGGDSRYGVDKYMYMLHFMTRIAGTGEFNFAWDDVYWMDDGVATLLGPSNFAQSNSTMDPRMFEAPLDERNDGGASLSIHYIGMDNTGDPVITP